MTCPDGETFTDPGVRGVARDGVVSSSWWHVPALLLLALLMFMPWTRERPLHGDAAMYATIAKTVAQTGELTRLTFNGRPYLNKPPLFFWLTAGVLRLSGDASVAPLLVSGLLGVLNVLLLYAICRRMGFDAAAAFAASLAYLTTHEVVHWTRGVHLESLLTLWLLVGVLAAYLSVTRPAAILLLGLAAGFGWLAKGPQALFATAVAPVLWWQQGLLRARSASRWTAAAGALFLLLVAPWTLAQIAQGSGYAGVYFGEQIGGMLLEPTTVPRGPLWYFGVLLKTYWPWLPFAVAGLVVLGTRWRSDPAARAWLVYGAIALLVTVSASARRGRYLFPLYPVLAVAAGVSLGRLARHSGRLLPALAGLALVMSTVVALVDREHASEASNLLRADAIEIARALPPDAEVWIASDVPQEGMPGITKVLGLHAPPLLCACGGRCPSGGAASEPLHVVVLAGSADELARQTGGSVVRRNRTLATLVVPPGPREPVLTHACALEPVMLPW